MGVCGMPFAHLVISCGLWRWVDMWRMFLRLGLEFLSSLKLGIVDGDMLYFSD